MGALESLLPLCRRQAQGCPDFLLLDALRQAAREFCRDSWFARRTLEVSLLPGVSHYDLTPPDADEEVIGVDAAEYRGRPLQPADPRQLPQRSGRPACFLWLPPATLELLPYPPADASGLDEPLRVSAVVQPTAQAQTLGDDLLQHWDQALAHGALARVCAMEGAAWSSPQLATRHDLLFYAARINAKGSALRAHMPHGLRVQPRRF
ncbi:hypothetical protein D0B54_17975 [Solimonas sp. K1W22B-7]|uniref:phage adaptor protein n=1 Tax=Solimonas sp. K1W22B-7 TaxID=2303331 RepID=UPI000E336D24|nr:hypothetical protein [Solimonas sp. K1W22B-7]AXQ30449.1 hypothetical protein D0B54_17975 [Solimonas sp. K1W22B-7]